MDRELRRRKRRERRRWVTALQKCGIAVAVLGLIGAAAYVYQSLPSVRVDKFLKAAKEYEEALDYDKALESYEEALNIESGTVKAYKYMANLYLDMEDYEAAEEILYRGVEETQDAGIQETYYTVKINESVYEINDENCSFQTVNRLLGILLENGEKESVYELLNICYELLTALADEKGINFLFITEEEGFGFSVYCEMLDTMLLLYERDGRDEMRQLLLDWAAVQAENLAFYREDFHEYRELLERVDAAVGGEELASLQGCLAYYDEIDELFSPLLKEFEAGEYAPARDFLVSEEYIAIRDAFIDGSMEYWKGETYISFSHIGVYLHYHEGSWQFSFMDEEDEAAEYGYIKVWGSRLLDNGHQRTVISYVPVSESGEYYPLTEYSMIYWWSTPLNIEATEDTYARMNFRFEENIYTENGKTTMAVNDWGGKDEYRDTYE